MNKLYVIGIGFRPLDKRAGRALLDSDVVLVNDRLLGVFNNYAEYEGVKDRIITHGSVYETLDYIADNYQAMKITLLAAGDPMFFGIGRLVIERLGKEAVEVHPDLSSIQVAFSRIRETSNNALLISLHGGPDPEKRRKLEYELADLPGLLERYNKIAVLTDKVNSPDIIAKTLSKRSAVSSQPAALKMYICEKLGYDDERVTEGSPEEIAKMSFSHPNVVIITVGAWRAMPLPVFGLKESEIQHSKGLITKDEVRAVTIHKLKLPKTGVFWDIGAGSGSVSIETARLCPGIRVYAVEKDGERIRCINENRDKFTVLNIEIMQGEAPDALKDLPAPDRVFIGGSSGRLEEIIRTIKSSHASKDPLPVTRHPSPIIVINATTIETLNEAVQSLEKNDFKVDVSEVSVSRSKIVGGKKHMSALNPVFIITGEKD